MQKPFNNAHEKEESRDWLLWTLLGLILAAYVALGSLMAVVYNLQP